jgi:predicted transcriptional regulator
LSLRRSKLDIALSVLSSVKDGLDKPTRIMYSSNLSWKPTGQILASLVSQGLLREILISGVGRSRTRYEITDKGLNVLDYFSGAEELLDLGKMTSVQ